MPKLNKQEIIRLYKKPSSMEPMEIWKYSGYFNSIATIKKYIKEAISTGEITNEDEAVFIKRNEIRQKEKEERKETLKSIVLKKILTCKSRKEIAEEIEQELGIKTNTTEVGSLIESLIQENRLTKEQYEEILVQVRQNAVKKKVLINQAKKEAKERLEL